MSYLTNKKRTSRLGVSILTSLLFCICCLAFAPNTALAQFKVSGTVISSLDKSPLPSVNVIEVGTLNGTATGIDGKFTLTVDNPNAQLSVSFVGYIKQIVDIAGQSELTIVLEEDQTLLDEVVVTGFGVERDKKKLGFAVTEVQGEEIAEANTVNPVASLQGKVAGVQINTGTGGPQSSSRITIRGNTSLTGNNQPIFVVDGVIIDNSTTGAGQWGGDRDFGNEMKNLNQDEFESVTVLKGAAASALYGSRGANGVIVITTKKGKQGTYSATLKQSLTVETVYAGPDFQNKFAGGIYGENGTSTNDDGELVLNGNATGGYSFGPRMDGRTYRDFDGQLKTLDPKENNFKEEYQTGVYSNTNVAVSGGNEKTTFRLSFTNNDTRGITPMNDFGKKAFRFQASQKVGDRVKLDGQVNFVRTSIQNPDYQGGNGSTLFRYVYYHPRHLDTSYWLDNYIDPVNGGIYNNQETGQNPYSTASYYFDRYKNRYLQDEDNLIGSLDLTVDITDWLKFLGKANFNNYYITNETKQLGSGKNYAGGGYAVKKTDRRQYRAQFLFNAVKSFDNGISTDVSVGGETWNSDQSYTRVSTVNGLRVPGQYTIANSVDQANADQRLESDARINALYAFATIDWKNMVFLDITARNDWASSLTYPNGSGDNSYFYPSATLAWAFSETLDLPDWLTFGKIRGSWAQIGNSMNAFQNQEGVNYEFSQRYNTDDGSYPIYNFNGGSVLGNSQLKPEMTTSVEFGADLRFFDNRLAIDAAWYKSNSKNQILPLELPKESGVTRQLINAGNIENRGIEIQFRGTPIRTRDFRWDTNINYTKNINKIIELADGVDRYALEYAMGTDVVSYAVPGQTYGDLYTKYAYTPYQAVNAQGEAIDHPNNGKHVITTDGIFVRSNDSGLGYRKVGNITPDFLLSWGNDFSYKNWNFGFLLDGRFGGEFLSATYNYGMSSGNLENSLPGRTVETGGIEYVDGSGNDRIGRIPNGVFDNGTVINGVDVSGQTYQEAYDQGLVDPVPTIFSYYYEYSWRYGIREAAIFESTWVALREIRIGYNAPADFKEALGLKTARINFVARNLLYLYNSLPDNINPEGLYNNRSGSAMEYGGVPFSRTFGFTLEVGI